MDVKATAAALPSHISGYNFEYFYGTVLWGRRCPYLFNAHRTKGQRLWKYFKEYSACWGGGFESPSLMCPLAKCTHGHPTAQGAAGSVSCASFQRKNCTMKLAAGNGTGNGNGVWFISALFFVSSSSFLKLLLE